MQKETMAPIILRECACRVTSFVYASTVFCVVAQVTSPVFLLSNDKEYMFLLNPKF